MEELRDNVKNCKLSFHLNWGELFSWKASCHSEDYKLSECSKHRPTLFLKNWDKGWVQSLTLEWHWNDIGIFWWCYRYPILGVMFPPKTHYIMNNANTMGIQWTGFYEKIRIIHLGTINCVSLLTRGHMIGKFLFLGSPILNNECSSIVNQK